MRTTSRILHTRSGGTRANVAILYARKLDSDVIVRVALRAMISSVRPFANSPPNVSSEVLPRNARISEQRTPWSDKGGQCGPSMRWTIEALSIGEPARYGAHALRSVVGHARM